MRRGHTPSAASALGCSVGELPDLLGELLRTPGCRPRSVGFRTLELEPDQLAAAMIAEENLPMYRNNCRLADDVERRQLATRTLAVWSDLWSGRP